MIWKEDTRKKIYVEKAGSAVGAMDEIDKLKKRMK